jgi:hypothetical protein
MAAIPEPRRRILKTGILVNAAFLPALLADRQMLGDSRAAVAMTVAVLFSAVLGLIWQFTLDVQAYLKRNNDDISEAVRPRGAPRAMYSAIASNIAVAGNSLFVPALIWVDNVFRDPRVIEILACAYWAGMVPVLIALAIRRVPTAHVAAPGPLAAE